MTTLAFDGKTLAYDSQMSYHSGAVEKVFPLPDGSLVGGAGDYTKILQSIAFLSGQGPKPDAEGENWPTLIRIAGKRIFVSVDCGGTWIHMKEKKFAVGSGGAYAMGAMSAGASAVASVKIAAKFDSYTGGKIKSVEV